jgi:hypothetical protein
LGRCRQGELSSTAVLPHTTLGQISIAPWTDRPPPGGVRNIFNKIITENFPNLEKDIPIQMQEVSKTTNRPDQNRTTPQHIIIKTTSSETRERILKAVREKNK